MYPVRDFEPEEPPIFNEVRHILNGLAFEDEHPEPAPMSLRTATKHLRNVLAFTQGERWRQCSVSEFVTPGGDRAFTASIRCPGCGEIETWIAYLDETNSFVFALPIEGE